ncbi:septin-2B-like isoform X2 [Mytilus californianus]|uniref:septin-2B-like isoform X2 n=1 Tax=Mytilus californianus TaxID=6549 RepID=UPI002246139A|nr:septin-2B-like isoform X2 [Mytilus californianus]
MSSRPKILTSTSRLTGTRTPKSPTSPTPGEATKRSQFGSVTSKTSVKDGTKTRKLSDDKSSSSSVRSSNSSIETAELHISEEKPNIPKKRTSFRETEQKPKETSPEDKSSSFLIKKRNSLRKTEGTGERSYIPRKSNSFKAEDITSTAEKFRSASSARKTSIESSIKTESNIPSRKKVNEIHSETILSNQSSVTHTSSNDINGKSDAHSNIIVSNTKAESDTEKLSSETNVSSIVTSGHVEIQTRRKQMDDLPTESCLSDKPKVFMQFTCPEQPGYVGFANLPNQVHRKSVKKGFEFTLMVVGESGLGKSTLVNSLFLTDLYPERQIHSAAEKIKQTVKIDASTVEIEERGVKLRLTVVDTPGFGDSLNSVDCFKPIIQYVDDQFERYLQDESGLNRRHIIDNRVHCCFYFINPSGHGLRPLDITFMRAVHHKVNIVPVIAKADTLTKHEVQRLKKRVLDQIDEYGISIYPLPDCDSDEDEDYREQCRQLKEAVPFAVIGANTVIEVKGRKVRGRMYPWGVVEVENPEHCDFIKLRTMLITHMQDLQEVTQEVHYENFRADKLAGGGGQAVPKKVRGRQREEAVEQDMVGGDEKEKQLQEKDAELRRMQEMVARMQAEMEQQKRMAGTPGKQNGGIKTENV